MTRLSSIGLVVALAGALLPPQGLLTSETEPMLVTVGGTASRDQIPRCPQYDGSNRREKMQ
jgi:hypothetical protein